MDVTVNPNLDDEFRHSLDCKRLLEAACTQGAEIARAKAPFPRIAESIDSRVEQTPDGYTGIIEARDWISHFWEFGFHHHEAGFIPARPFLRPAGETIGRFEPKAAE